MLAGVKVSEWAGVNGVSRQSVTGWLHAGVVAVPARQLAAGAVLVGAPGQAAAGVAVCARVSSCGLRGDLGWQVARLAGYLTAKGIAASRAVCGVGSGRNGCRTRVLGLLRDASAGVVVAGHRERLARFGAGFLVAAVAAQGGKLIVVGRAGVSGGLVRDMVEVCTGLSAGRSGRRPAGHRAGLALAATRRDQAG
jgi:predicted site-specific integrase-resolvase